MGMILPLAQGLEESDIQIHQPWYRELMGKTFDLFVQAISSTWDKGYPM